MLAGFLTLHLLGKKNPKTKNQTKTTNLHKTNSKLFQAGMLVSHLFFYWQGRLEL